MLTTSLAVQYEFDAASPCYRIQVGQVRYRIGPDPASQTWTRERDMVWELISSLTLWFLWRARCSRVFEDRQEPPAETVRAIWLDLVHTLRGQYSQLRTPRSQRHFRYQWWEGLLYTNSSSGLRWQYRPPLWLFPPPIV